MYNDFRPDVPSKKRPRGVNGGTDIVAALRLIKSGARRSSRAANRSRRHTLRAQSLETAGIDIEEAEGPWYRESARAWARDSTAAFGIQRNTCFPDRAPALRSRTAATSHLGRGRQRLFFQPVRRDLVNPQNHAQVKRSSPSLHRLADFAPQGQKAIPITRSPASNVF